MIYESSKRESVVTQFFYIAKVNNRVTRGIGEKGGKHPRVPREAEPLNGQYACP